MSESRPLVGVACLLYRQGSILLSRRDKSPQKNSWQCPGGFLQANESLSEAGHRILQQHLGISVDSFRTQFYTNNIFQETAEHTVTLYLTVCCKDKEISIENWQWFDFKSLPEPLFLPVELLVENYSTELNILIDAKQNSQQNTDR